MCSVKTTREIAGDILAYLARHPEADDTVAGIAEWWLLEQELRCRTTDVRNAVAELVAQNLITERKGEDAQIHYRVNKDKTEEIAALLNKKSN
jgi:hypothetical protein